MAMWILQEIAKGITSDSSNYLSYRNKLEELGIDYRVVRYANGKLNLLNDDYTVRDDGGEALHELLKNPFIAIGSVKLHEELGSLGAYKLSQDFKIDFENIEDLIGRDDLLNPPSEGIVGTIRELIEGGDLPYRFHMRPIGDNKLLNGNVYMRSQAYEMIEGAEGNGNRPFLNAKFMVSQAKEILSEYRFFVVGGEIVAQSSYLDDMGRLDTSLSTSDELMKYARGVLSKFAIPNNIVMDIAETPDGYKIIEFNELIASGLYSSNVEDIILASENYANNVDNSF